MYKYISRFKLWWTHEKITLCFVYCICIRWTISSEWRAHASSSSERWMPAQFHSDDKKIPINVEISMLNRKGIYAIDEIYHDGIFQCQIIWSICIDIYRIDDVICRCDVIFVIEITVAWRKCLTSDLKRSENEKRKTMPTVLYRSKIKWSALFKWCINGISDA